MAQQYSYGYGYGYGQPAAGYGVQMAGYGAAAAAASVPARPPQPASYQVASYTPKPLATLIPQPGQAATQAQAGYYSPQGVGSAAPAAPVVTAQPSAAPLPQQPQPAASYYGYQQYRPPAPQQPTASYAAYYQQPTSAPATKATPTAVVTSAHQGVGYGSSPAVAMPSVAYPNTYSSQYYSSNRYGAYNSTSKDFSSKPGPASAAPSYTPSSASYNNTSSYTSAQEKVIANYIVQKTTGAPAAGAGAKFGGKKYNPNNQAVYFCEVCKISCASSMTYKTHLEGKAHKKKLNSQQATNGKPVGVGEVAEGGGESSNKPYFCPLCEVQCTSKDSYEAHIRGTRHTKVLNLYRRLGKPIPDIKLPAGSEITTTVGGKKLNVSAPRINFVGGQQLTSTGASESSVLPKLYPPGGPTTTAGGGGAGTETEIPGGEDNQDEAHEIEAVGEQFVIAVTNDPKFPHATFKCTMCDCYFNDEWARKAHSKGRRHRLNYKKLYQPDLYVEPSKTNRKKAEQNRAQRKIQAAAREREGGERGERGGRGGRGGGRGGGGHHQHQSLVADVENLRQQEAEEIAKLQSKNNPPLQEMETEFFADVPPAPPLHPHYEVEPPSHFYPSRPRNPRDDRLVMNKHGSICPVDSEIKAVQQAVADVEGILKSISDDVLDETCKTMSEEQGKEVGRDEKLRKLKGVMRVGAFARSLMLRGECSVDLVLMCTGKPTAAFFSDIARRMPVKFEELSSELVYNVNQDVGRAAILVISQVEEHRVQVTLTLTSTEMREIPSPEQSQADEEAGVLHRPSCNAALAALRHTKWFQMMAQGLPSCGILMRVLKDICRRVPAWGVLDSWILELLVQKSLTSANPDYTRPGDAFRRVMECVASGIFLPGGSGLQDPCEKGLVDASACLSAQERVNITLSAQHALRLIAFGKIHLVLGVDPLPPPGSRRDPPGGDKTEDKAGETKEEEEEAVEPEAKRPCVADSKE